MVDAAWSVLKCKNPAYFDGDVLHVLSVNRTGCGGATLQVAPSSYRFHAIGNLGIQPLGAKGICNKGNRFLCGLRGEQMGMYPNMWEFAPSGMIEPTQTPQEVIEKELSEETGLTLSTKPVAIALFFDAQAGTWEIVFRLQAEGDLQIDGTEYVQLDWFERENLPRDMSPPAIQMKSLL